MKIENKIFVVTGAGGGVGQALVLELLESGAAVAAVDVNPTSLDQVYSLSNKHPKLSCHVIDLTEKTEVERLLEEVLDKHETVDAIINNAGIIQDFIAVDALSDEKIHQVMSVNFFGTLHMIRTFLPELKKRPEAYILNVSSMGGFLPVPGQTIYGASKAAVRMLSEGLDAELSDTNVHVSYVMPGGIQTNITKNSGLKDPKDMDGGIMMSLMLKPEKAAHLILRAIKHNKLHNRIGKDSRFMYWLYKLSPRLAGQLIQKAMKNIG